MSEENSIKVILIGMSGTGKTNIIKALMDNPFQEESQSTLSSSFIAKNVTIEKKKYQVELWDTAGQEKYRSLTKIFIVFSKIVIFVYDITQRKTFEDLDFWVETAKESLGDSPIYALFGNKKDLYLNEQVEESEGEKKANEIGAIFKLTSAKNERENLNEYLEELIKMYIKKAQSNDKESVESTHREQSFALTLNKKKKKKAGCCEKND